MTEINWALIDATLLDVKSELLRATKKFGPFNSALEGWAVIYEEFNKELFDEITKKPPNTWKMRNEALQVCAMALRFIHDITPVLDKS